MKEFFKAQLTTAIACDASMLSVGDGLKEIQLIPDGVVESTKGTFVVDEESAQLIQESFQQRGGELLIDFEHQSLGGEYASPMGLAPAAGWIRNLWHSPGRGIRAMVQWNERAREFIRAGEYKKLSPVAIVRKSDRKVVAIDSAALTNRPAIANLEAVAAKDSGNNSDTEISIMADGTETGGGAAIMERLVGELTSALRDVGVELQDVNSDAVLQAAVEWIRAKRDGSKDGSKDATAKPDSPSADKTVANAIRRRLNLDCNASESEALLAISMMQKGSDRASQAESSLAAMRDNEADRLAQERVERFVHSNVINPKDNEQMTHALALARENPERFEALMQRSTPWVQAGSTSAPSGGAAKRSQVIANSSREFKSADGVQGITSVDAFVNDALSSEGLPALTETELTAL